MKQSNIKFIIRVTKKCETPWKQSWSWTDVSKRLDDSREKYYPYAFAICPINRIFDDYIKPTWQDIRDDSLWDRGVLLSWKLVDDWCFIDRLKKSGFILGSSRGSEPDILSFNTRNAFAAILADILKKEHDLLVTDDYEDTSHAFLFDVNFILSDSKCELVDYSVHDIEEDNSYDTLLMKNHSGKREELLNPTFRMMFEAE